jgi:hypothetical protein
MRGARRSAGRRIRSAEQDSTVDPGLPGDLLVEHALREHRLPRDPNPAGPRPPGTHLVGFLACLKNCTWRSRFSASLRGEESVMGCVCHDSLPTWPPAPDTK